MIGAEFVPSELGRAETLEQLSQVHGFRPLIKANGYSPKREIDMITSTFDDRIAYSEVSDMTLGAQCQLAGNYSLAEETGAHFLFLHDVTFKAGTECTIDFCVGRNENRYVTLERSWDGGDHRDWDTFLDLGERFLEAAGLLDEVLLEEDGSVRAARGCTVPILRMPPLEQPAEKDVVSLRVYGRLLGLGLEESTESESVAKAFLKLLEDDCDVDCDLTLWPSGTEWLMEHGKVCRQIQASAWLYRFLGKPTEDDGLALLGSVVWNGNDDEAILISHTESGVHCGVEMYPEVSASFASWVDTHIRPLAWSRSS